MRSENCIAPAAFLTFGEARGGSGEQEAGQGLGEGTARNLCGERTPRQPAALQRGQEAGAEGGNEGLGGRRRRGREGGREGDPRGLGTPQGATLGSGDTRVPRAGALSFPLAFWQETGTVGEYLGNPKSGMTQSLE